MIDTFATKEIKNFELCPVVDGPSVNITHKEDYEAITICWRFFTTAYPHCAGQSADIIVVKPYSKDASYVFDYRVYAPISGMSEDGKQAGWLGVSFEETSEGKGEQITWRSILYDNPLKIFEWQSVCVSYSKKTKKLLMFHNGVKYLDFLVDEDHTFISKYFLSHVNINARRTRGSFSDLHVYSTPMDEDSLSSWTTCTYDKPGDVYAWNINDFNLTHDESIVSAVEKIDTKLFCKSKGTKKKEIHLFGDDDISSISYYEGKDLCKRLNGRITPIPKDLAGNMVLYNLLKDHGMKTNNTWAKGWVEGITNHGEKYGSSHWVPKKLIFEVFDPETGEPLLNDINKQFVHNEVHSYQKLVHLCFECVYYPPWENAHNEYNFLYFFQKCNRNYVGKVLCEFEELPTIKIKGLCKNSPIDRNFQLLETKVGDGKFKEIIKN